MSGYERGNRNVLRHRLKTASDGAYCILFVNYRISATETITPHNVN